MTLYPAPRRLIGRATFLELVTHNIRRPLVFLGVCCLSAVVITWVRGWWEPPRSLQTLIRLWCLYVALLSMAGLLQLAFARRWIETLNLAVLSGVLVLLCWNLTLPALEMFGLYSPVMIVPVNP